MAEKKKPTRRRKKKSSESDSPTVIMKAKILGNESSVIPRSNLLDLDEASEANFTGAGAIEPPISPLVLARLHSVSNSLRQNIDAMATNIDGFGHTFDPVIKFDTSEGFEQVRIAMIIERELEGALLSSDPKSYRLSKADEPSDDEVREKIEELKRQSRIELARSKNFFDNVSPEYSFTRLRRKMRIDKETTGYAVWEVLRDQNNVPRRIVYAQSWTFRALPKDKKETQTTRLVKVTDIKWEEEEEHRIFRRYVQDYEGRIVYFKEFGDPRVLSADKGDFYDSEEDLEAAEGEKARQATELIWFKIDSPESETYGAARYIGNVLSVIGSREMEEVNYAFWEHKAIPPMVIMISGGHLAKGAQKKIESILEDQLKGGRENFHKVMIIQAEPIGKGLGSAGAISSQNKVKIELRPLLEGIWKDQIWGEYDRSNRLKVGQSFRIPPIIRGETQDFNRATAEAAKDFVEEQVFQPERSDTDFDINRTLMNALRITLWTYKTKAPVARQPDKVVEFIDRLSKRVVKVNEGRQIVSDALGTELPKIDAPWAELPSDLALAGIDPEEESNDQDSAGAEQNKPSGDKLPTKVINIKQSVMDELVVPHG